MARIFVITDRNGLVSANVDSLDTWSRDLEEIGKETTAN